MSTNRQTGGKARPRRRHHKSRGGCRECKRRHIKCDEQRPSCINCRVSSRHCEYLALNLTAASDEVLRLSPSPTAYIDRATSPGPPKPTVQQQYSDPQVLEHDRNYTLEHMKLFHHVEHGITTWLGATDFMTPLVEQYIETALTTPYLMNQLLALSALHLSYISTHDAARYRSLATELQTRGLSLFNAMNDYSDGIPRWYFSSLLAMHNLATTLADCHLQEFDTFLDSFISQIELHQGTQAIGKGSWNAIQSSGLRQWLDHLEESNSATSSPSDAGPCMFARMLQTSRLNTASINTCWEASSALLHVREKMQGPNGWGPHAAMAWPNLISKDFISLLSERVPEALLIMAHYAEMLYTYRDYWVFGDSGEYLINGLAARLGGSWSQWLKRPLAVLSDSRPVDP